MNYSQSLSITHSHYTLLKIIIDYTQSLEITQNHYKLLTIIKDYSQSSLKCGYINYIL